AEAHETSQDLRDRVGLPALRGQVDALERERQAVLLPGPRKQLDQAVVKQIQKVAKRAVAGPDPVQDGPRVMVRQHALRTDQSKEGNADLEAPWLLRRAVLLEAGHGAGGKAQRRKRPKAHRFLLGRYVVADGRQTAAAGQVAQQAHRLEEIKLVRGTSQLVAQLRARSPVRGGQRHSTPPVCWSRLLVTATKRVNEFRVQYRA